MTRAGTKLGKLFLPGMEGTAAYLIALVMLLKGYRIRGIIGLDMPSNWLALHPGFSKENAEAIIERAKPRAETFIDAVLSGERRISGFLCLALGLLLLKLSLMYLIVARFVLSKLFIADNRCDGCGICSQKCPSHAIVMLGGKPKRPYWSFRCESCMRCMAYCPKQAVQACQSWAIVLGYVTSIPVGVYVLKGLSQRSAWVASLNSGTVGWIIQYVYVIGSVYLAYLVLNASTRVPFINALFTYTTFTRLYRRYHEPDTDLKDL